MGIFKQHEPCPNCGSRDNLARYDDGSATCFGCGHYERATISGFVAQKQQEEREAGVRWPLPDDFNQDYSEEAVAWIQQYDIPVTELLQRGVGFSQRSNQLIFTFYQGDELVLWQARNFTEGRKKYFTAGDKNNVDRYYRVPSGVGPLVPRRLVVVEDCVSALKIARQCDSLPCLGATLTNTMIASLRASYDSVAVWLDGNKADAAQDIVRRAGYIGLSAFLVWTELDPKFYTNEQIKEYIK